MLLSSTEDQEPSSEDIEILVTIINSLKGLTRGKLSDAEKSFKSVLKSNKNERVGIVSAMGYCGILNVPDYKPFHQTYTPYYNRKHSSYGKSDWPFPADLWLPKNGINQESVDYWFGSYIS